MRKSKLRRLALWACFCIFAVTWALHLEDWIWGTLGLIRSGEVEDGMISASYARHIIGSLQEKFNSLFRWLTFSLIIFFGVLVWIEKSSPEIRAQKQY